MVVYLCHHNLFIDMANNPLRQYIDQSRATQRSDADIRTDLKNAGWSDENISEALLSREKQGSGFRRRTLVGAILLFILLGGGVYAMYYAYSKQIISQHRSANANVTPSLDSTKSNAELSKSPFYAQNGDCLKKQDWYTHEGLRSRLFFDNMVGWLFTIGRAEAQVSIDFPNEEPSLPPIKENPCQEIATWNTDGELLRFLANSVDPIILIELAFNPHTPHDVQWNLYLRRSSLPSDWRAIDETAGFNRSSTPQQWMVSNFAQNHSLDPQVMDGEAFMPKIEIAWMVHDPNDPDNGAYPYGKVNITPPSQALLNEIDKLVRLNDPQFNLEVSGRKGLLNSTIEYLLTDIDYKVTKATTFGSPYQGIQSVNDEVHKNISQHQIVTHDLLLTQLTNLRSCKYDYECDIAPENLRQIERDLISKNTRDFFYEDTTPLFGGETRGKYNYSYLLQDIATSPLYGGVITSTQMHNGVQTSSETLQLLLDTYANQEMLAGLAKGGTSNEYFSAFQKAYPDLIGSTSLQFERALSFAYDELRRREKLAAWVPPAQRTLVWDMASWWELEDSRVDSIGKCDDGTTFHPGRKVYLMSLGVGYDYVSPATKELDDKIRQKVLADGWNVCGQGPTEKTAGYQQDTLDTTYQKNGYLLTIRTFPDRENLLNYAFEYDAK